MRKAVFFLLALMLLFSLTMGVSADQVDQSNFSASVEEDGSCQVSMTVTLSMETMDTTMRFPIPANATDVQLNGFGVGTYYAESVQYVNLGSVLNAEDTTATFFLSYRIRQAVDSSGKLDLPLLQGFQLPISSFSFSVSFPGTVTNLPHFTSAYHQSNIESSLYWNVLGSTVSGQTNPNVLLNGHETLYMTLQLDGDMFSHHSDAYIDYQVPELVMQILAGLALVYWILFMRPGLPKVRRCSQPPHGFTAGHMRPILTLGGPDLSLMVLSWAQMGYVLLERRNGNKILIHRQMDMGNERSAYEQQIFSLLFRKNHTVDTKSLAYAALCGKVEKQLSASKSLSHRHNGNPLIFRIFFLAIHLLTGVNLGLTLGGTAGWQIVLLIFFGILGLVAGHLTQEAAWGILLWKPGAIVRGLLATGIWVLPFLFCGGLSLGLQTALLQLLAGLFAVYGGRRSADGTEALSQVLGLDISFLVPEKSTFTLAKKADPEYFHILAPYALALGTDRLFAYRFGKERIAECPYLVGVSEAERTATQWSRILRNTVRSMNARYEGLKKEQLINSIYNLRSR